MAIGVLWLVNVLSAESESHTIQRRIHATAVIDERSFRSSCLHFTCNQTEYRVRYPAEGRVYRARVLADGWEHDHSVGSTIEVVYEQSHPGRVEIAGRAPSSGPPTLGAALSLAFGALLVLSWTWAGLRRRSGSRGLGSTP
jgi:hypothetical protein